MENEKKEVIFDHQDLKQFYELSLKENPMKIVEEFYLIKNIQPNIISAVMIVLNDKNIDAYTENMTTRVTYTFWQRIRKEKKVYIFFGLQGSIEAVREIGIKSGAPPPNCAFG